MSSAYTTMQTSIKTTFINLWKAQSAKATQDGQESIDPEVIINQMANDMATAIAQAVEAYVAAGDVIVSGANITGTNGGGAVVFTPASPAKMTHT